MKTRALAIDNRNNKTKYVTAFDAIYLREFDSVNYKHYSFCYETPSSEKIKLIPKFLKKYNTAFFSFESVSDAENCYQDEGESLTHYVAKKALSRIKNLHLIDIRTDKEYFLNVSYAENEKRFDLDNMYFSDVYYKIDKNQIPSMMKYFYKWQENLVLEVCVTHKVEELKRDIFFKNGIPVFEILIPEKTRDNFNLDNKENLTKEKIDEAIEKMVSMFEKGIKGIFISEPVSEEYKIMSNYKSEIAKFKEAREKAEKEYTEAEKRLEIINLHIRTAEKNRHYYESMENKIIELEEKIKKLEKEIKISKKHPVKHLLVNLSKGVK